MNALQKIQEGNVGTPFLARILNDSKVQDHADLRPLIGQNVTVHEIVKTKKGPALKFRTARGVTMQILAHFAEFVPHDAPLSA